MSASGVAREEEVPGVANDAGRAARGRWYVSKHDCIKHGEGDGIPCRQRCPDPWQADDPANKMGGTFATWAQALAWADKSARRSK